MLAFLFGLLLGFLSGGILAYLGYEEKIKQERKLIIDNEIYHVIKVAKPAERV